MKSIKQYWKEFDVACKNPFTWLACIAWCLMGLIFGWIMAFPHHLEIDIGENMISGLDRGCDQGCLHATSIEYGLTGKAHFEEFNNTPLYHPCGAYCLAAYGSQEGRP